MATRTQARERREATQPSDEQVDKWFVELLEGIRATLPGVQVLFAFLLAVPVQAGFQRLSDVQRAVFVVALASAAISSILLIAPSVHQRLRARVDGIPRRHLSHVQAGAKLGNAGSIVFGISMVASTWLAVSVAAVGWIAIGVAGLVLAVTLWAWFWLPMRAFAHDDD